VFIGLFLVAFDPRRLTKAPLVRPTVSRDYR
jgi:hypothetical protein